MNGTVPPETEAALVVWVSRALSRSLKGMWAKRIAGQLLLTVESRGVTERDE